MEGFALISKLGEFGVAYLLLAISIFFNWQQFKIIQILHEKRTEDAKQVTNTILEPMRSIKQTVDLILTVIQSNINTKKV